MLGPVEKWKTWGDSSDAVEKHEDSILFHVIIKGILLRALQFIEIPPRWEENLNGNGKVFAEIIYHYYLKNEGQKGRMDILHRGLSF